MFDNNWFHFTTSRHRRCRHSQFHFLANNTSSMQIAGLGTRGTGTCGTGTAGLGQVLQGQWDWDMRNWDSGTGTGATRTAGLAHAELGQCYWDSFYNVKMGKIVTCVLVVLHVPVPLSL